MCLCICAYIHIYIHINVETIRYTCTQKYGSFNFCHFCHEKSFGGRSSRSTPEAEGGPAVGFQRPNHGAMGFLWAKHGRLSLRHQLQRIENLIGCTSAILVPRNGAFPGTKQIPRGGRPAPLCRAEARGVRTAQWPFSFLRSSAASHGMNLWRRRFMAEKWHLGYSWTIQLWNVKYHGILVDGISPD